MRWTKTKKIKWEDRTITVMDINDEVTGDVQTFNLSEEAKVEFYNIFDQINNDSNYRIEMQKQDIWTVYEKTTGETLP